MQRMKVKPPGISFEPTEIVLLTEHRVCNCEREYVVPNAALLVRCRSGYTTAQVDMRTLINDPELAGLPRSSRDFYTKAEVCKACFATDDGQMSLFPRPPAPKRFVPRQFRGDRVLSGVEEPEEKPAKYVPKLEDF